MNEGKTALSTRDIPASWPVSYDHTQFTMTLQEALRKANQLQHDILASYVQPVAWYDPHRLFAARRCTSASSFFWEQPAEQIALIGIGEAVQIETAGTERFTAINAARKKLVESAIIRSCNVDSGENICGPLFFGGFAFDTERTHACHWTEFPDGLLILPDILLSCHAKDVFLTLNQVVQPGDDVQRLAEKFLTLITQLQRGVEQDISPANISLVEQADPHFLSAADWMNVVAETVTMIQQNAYEKVVLARGIKVVPTYREQSFDIDVTLQRLSESYPGAYLFALQRGEHYFIGATPERLISMQNGHMQTMALAGSAPRGSTPEEDATLGTALLHSGKNLEEHELVITMICDHLAPLCSSISVSETPQLLQLKNVQHLITYISGELLPERNILDVVAELHPTPAVGGFPREAALEAIRTNEQFDRGWYAGPIGWLDAAGNGQFAVALRSALVNRERAILFAGCGIVADSDPVSEYEESCLKLRAMLLGLGCME